MADDAVDRVRSFNRLVTERVGALNDHYLSRGRPLGEARVLWEIGVDGCDVRRLRSRLGLDAGYLSRLLRALERDGLIRVVPSRDDRRVRTARLTAAGRRERDLLDRRSDELAESLLAPLTGSRQQRLVAAMEEVERLLTASLVELDIVDPATASARFCLREYFAELDRRFDGGFNHALTPAELEAMRPPAGLFVVAMLHGEPVGCGGLRFNGDEPTDLKRMWVAESARGLGLGRRMLAELERLASEHGTRVLRLETNKNLAEAVLLYRSSGYDEVAPFNDLPYAHHWFAKRLA